MFRPKEEPVQRTVEKRAGNLTSQVEKHPAFGAIQIHRVTGHTGKLFGSHLNEHMGVVRVSIRQAERIHDLSHDRVFPTTDSFIEVDLSFVQFAELLTSMNMGEGVPCTIRRLNGEGVPSIPQDLETEQEKVAVNFREEMGRLGKELEEISGSVSKVLAKKTLGKEDRRDIKRAFDTLVSKIQSHAPFVMDRFIESAEQTKKAAKAEIDGFLTGVLHRTGLEGLREHLIGPSSEQPKTLAEVFAAEEAAEK